MTIRIQKYLSQQGILSRRKTEEYLQKGLIKVNGQIITELGFAIDPEIDKIELDQQIINIKNNYSYLAFYKPKGIVTNCAKDGEKEIKDLLPPEFKHLSAIGRLDKDSEGLILLTDDGIFTKSILTADPPHFRQYEVCINEALTPKLCFTLENGVYILGKKTLPLTIKTLAATKLIFNMQEGRNRQIRRMLRSVNRCVLKLKRLSFGSINLGDLIPGQYRIYTAQEIKQLMK